MTSLKDWSQPIPSTAIEQLDQFFSPEHQRIYINQLMERGGLTRRRAEYFIRLWAYLQLKYQAEQGQPSQAFTQLLPLDQAIPCTHREAAELFYKHRDRGSDRAAGMMIDRLASLGLLEKRFDGQTLCLQIRNLPELLIKPAKSRDPIKLEADAFNPRTDAIPAANLIARTYAELIQSNRSFKDPLTASHKIARTLRLWSQHYPTGIRVLRRQDNLNPVGISVFYPTTCESEANFFQPLSKSFYLTSDTEVDVFKAASPGDVDCTSVYVRVWTIDTPYFHPDNLRLLLEDSQETLLKLRQDFPNLCDIYSAIVHPMYEELKLALGFQEIGNDKQRSYSWIYLAVDRFLSLDVDQVLSSLKFSANSEKC